MKEIFEDIIKNNKWKKHPCGPGSTLRYTENLRITLGPFLEKHNIQSMLDAPCGDYSWMSVTSLPSVKKYIGGDIAEFLIKKNQQKYPAIQFINFDLTMNQLPDVDLLFCRDCLLHLDFDNIKKIFENISRSNVKFVLLSNWYEDAENSRDIQPGESRYLNFLENPFNFAPPIDSIVDYIEGFPRREMLLWPKSVIDNYSKGIV
jgi:hypothetical protein